MTTKNIIKILPFDAKFKTELFNKYDDLDDDRKAEIMDVLWSGYYEYYQLKLNENIDRGLAVDIDEKNKEKLDATFFQRMVAKTEKEIQDSLSNSDPAIDLSSAREELQKIMNQKN